MIKVQPRGSRTVIRWVGGFLAVVAASVLLPVDARAEPYMALREGRKCGTCHVNQTGGGMRTLLANTHMKEITHYRDIFPELDEAAEGQLVRRFGRAYQLITRPERLRTVARDLVRHFAGRGFRGKAMYVGIDKATAVRMFDLVQQEREIYLGELRGQRDRLPELERAWIESQIELLETTDTAVVVPVNKTIVMHVTGADVIHSWTIPAFGVKQDAVPGRTARLWFKAEKEGTYFGQCSELCGKDHAYMPITVKVVSQEEYDEWLDGAIEEYAGTPRNVDVASIAE